MAAGRAPAQGQDAAGAADPPQPGALQPTPPAHPAAAPARLPAAMDRKRDGHSGGGQALRLGGCPKR